jgi:Zn-dependent peptidase ImmA (M78 family)
MEDKYETRPVSRQQLRDFASGIRTKFGLGEVLLFPIVEFMELNLPTIDPEFQWEIVEKDILSEEIHADTDPVARRIRIREDVYEGAVAGNGRDRMTVAHELAHYLLLVVLEWPVLPSSEDVPAYRDPEWQAKALAGELLIPHQKIQGMDCGDVMETFGVSLEAAEFALRLR